MRQMTTSVHVLELNTSAQGHTAYLYSIPVQNVGGSGEISHEFPPPTSPQFIAHVPFTSARRAMFGRSARARATDSGSETLHVPTIGSKQPRTALVLCRGAYLRPSFKKFPRSRLYNNKVGGVAGNDVC